MQQNRKMLVVAAMSGGVDSSVAALLLKRRGYHVVGVFIRSYNLDGCQDREAEDARRVAEYLRIPFYVWDLEKEYRTKVVSYLIEEYRCGRTPNPDVMCNRDIKFGVFLRRALAIGANAIATGHYARRKALPDGSFALFPGKDAQKDQSYFLWTLTQHQLAHTLFPLGTLTKTRVRQMAKSAGLPTAEKKDSQGICFLGNISLRDFLKEHIPQKKGKVLTPDGTVIGTHEGAHLYTIGQRRGIGAVKHQKGVTEHVPLYVVAKDIARNTITVAPRNDSRYITTTLRLEQVHRIREYAIHNDEEVLVRLRYRQPLIPARLRILRRKSAILTFSSPTASAAPGQSAVWYRKNGEVGGGGIIAAEHLTK